MKKPSTTAESSEFPPPAPPPPKKTRELPNLSDCHCCNRRINSTNPKNRLQILASMWRIVLLCKSCYNLVESSQCCSYCLLRVSSSKFEPFYDCKRCRRKIHKHCVSMLGYSGSNCSSSGSDGDDDDDDDLFVCFDCSIPKLLENEYNARVNRSRMMKKKGGVKVGGEMTNSLGSSGVCDSFHKGKVVEDALNDVKKKVKVMVEAKEKAVDRASVAKRAVRVACSAVGMFGMDKGGGDQKGLVVDEDAELAFRLHRAMNSSPRIMRNSCLLNTHSVDVPEVNGVADGVEVCCSSKIANGVGQECDQMCDKMEDEKRNGDIGGSWITYSRRGQGLFEVMCKEEPACSPRTCNGECSSGDVMIKEEPYSPLQTYIRRPSKVKRRKLELGHCSKTYSRRHSTSPNCKSKMMYDSCNLDNGTVAPDMALNLCEESRAFTTT